VLVGQIPDPRRPVAVQPPEGGLTKSSILLCEQVGAANALRLRRRRGVVNSDTLAAVTRVVKMFIDKQSWTARIWELTRLIVA